MGLDVLVVMPTAGRRASSPTGDPVRCGKHSTPANSRTAGQQPPGRRPAEVGRGIHGWPRSIGPCSPAPWDVHRGCVLQWIVHTRLWPGRPRLTDIRLLMPTWLGANDEPM